MVYFKSSLVLVLGWGLYACGGNGSNTEEFLDSPGTLQTSAISTEAVLLKWSDNSLDEDGFIIEKSIDNIAFEEVARVTSNNNEYTDSNTIHDEYVFYRVAAYKGTLRSAYSDVSEVLHYRYDACSEPAAEAGVVHGNFFPFVVSGLNYSTGGNYTVTASDSSFNFGKDPLINFSIGYIPVAQVNTGLNITLLDFVAGSQATSSEIQNIKFNVTRLLMALDSDEFNDNGIQLSCELSTATGVIDFSLDELAFSEQTDVIALLNGRQLSDQSHARTYLYSALYEYFAGDYTLQYENDLGGVLSFSAGTISFTLLADGSIENVICFDCPAYTSSEVQYDLDNGNYAVFKFNTNETIGIWDINKIRVIANFGSDFSINGFNKHYALLFEFVGTVEGSRD